MKRKLLTLIILCVTLLFCIVGLTACGDPGKSAYEIWLDNGYTGTEEDFLNWQKGEKGDKGEHGDPDEDPQGLDFNLLQNGTYAVTVGKAKYLESIVIPSTYNGKAVISIGRYAFEDCTSLTSISIPKSVTSIGESAFYGCNNLTKINYFGTIDNWCEIIFVDFHANPIAATYNYGGKGKLYINDELVTEANITAATKINSYAFAGFVSLTNISIPNSITSIGSGAFECCNNLQYKEYENAYYLGNKENHYLVLHHVSSTPNSIAINDNTKVIYSSALVYGNLNSLIIPNSIKSVGRGIFFTLSFSLNNVYYKGTSVDWSEINGIDMVDVSSVTLYYYSETKPIDSGNYWHFDTDGITPTIWAIS